MATITYDAAAPGKGATRPVFAQSPRAVKIVTGVFSFDASYPTGGEDISDIFNQFRGSEGISVSIEQPILAGAQTGKFLKVDRPTKKVLLFTNAQPFAEVANGSDQSAIAGLAFTAIGYA